MRHKFLAMRPRMVLAICTIALFAMNTLAASEKTVHILGRSSDGAYPYYSNLIFDAAGNLYGMTYLWRRSLRQPWMRDRIRDDTRREWRLDGESAA